ncbi:MAG: hypothetical protein RJA70_3882 [Pseudomonadota bacterium]|jgi:NADH-quinone oxidoreductase subunit L
MNSAWSILFVPLFVAALLGSHLVRPRKLVASISIAASVFTLAQSLRLLLNTWVGDSPAVMTAESLRWLVLPGGFAFEFGFLMDHASILLLVVVTSVATLVQVFSLGYMKDDPGFTRYYALLSMFAFAMIGIVASTNLAQMFFFWELVGLASYFLIGFWFTKNVAETAAKKAMLTNRVGDFGFLCGILIVWWLAGSLDFSVLAERWSNVAAVVHPDTATWLALAAVLIFCGAIGKSAQLPLHVWLPDAMEGPTPVSALIHAATMVAAGVYMLYRTSFLLDASPIGADVVAWVGALTSLFAALLALAQTDVKRVLAYSTMSQLGYMVMATGAGNPDSALFHLTTHAFFKALLFLAAASVLHAVHHERDAWKMGGLSKKLPITCATFALGALALSGVWPLSGFFSKDLILLGLAGDHAELFAVALATALLTPFYIGRTFCLVFLGQARDAELRDHAHESPWMMTGPLVILAALAICAGWGNAILGYINPAAEAHAEGGVWGSILPFLPVPGLGLAYVLYGRGRLVSDPLANTLGPVFKALRDRLYVDELYSRTVLALLARTAQVVEFVDSAVLGRAVPDNVGRGVLLVNRGVRAMQSGYVGAYLFVFGAGAALLFFLLTT